MVAIEEAISAGGVSVVVVSAHGLERLQHEHQLRRWFRLIVSIRDVRRETLQAIARDQPDLVYVRRFPGDHLALTHRIERLGVPYVMEVHTIGSDEYASQGKPIRGRVFARLERASLRNSCGIVAVTEEMRRAAVLRSGRKLPSIAIGNGVDTTLRPRRTREEVRRELGVSSETTVLVMAGFSRPWHGVDRALRLLAALSPPEPSYGSSAPTTTGRLPMRRVKRPI